VDDGTPGDPAEAAPAPPAAEAACRTTDGPVALKGVPVTVAPAPETLQMLSHIVQNDLGLECVSRRSQQQRRSLLAY